MAVTAAVLTLHSSFAQETALPLAEARAQIGAVVEDPSSMTGVMRQLAPSDQTAFLADVNAAIAKMPGSNEEKAARFLNVNRAALKGAAKGNLADLVAEVFATVPPEALTIVNERFAADLFNRSADPSRTYTDDEYVNIATNLMAKIESRTAGTDDAAVRNTFAAAMLVRASNGSPADLADKLVATMPEGAERDLAKNEWLPAALAEPADYEPMLAYADAGRQPSPSLALQLSGPQLLDAFLADVASSLLDEDGRETTPFTDQAFGGFTDPVFHAAEGSILNTPTGGGEIGSGQPPRSSDPNSPVNPSARRSGGELPSGGRKPSGGGRPTPTPTPTPTPRPPIPPPYDY